MGRLAQALVIALGLAGTQAAHASTSRDVSFRPDPFAAAPKLSQPSIAEQLKALEERANRASACVALCELAASIDAHPLGREVSIHAPIRTEGYTGHYWDKEASLYYAKARYYDPFTARFTQSDSFLGNIDDPPSLHRYFYAHANPTSYWDPTGHESFAAACQGYSGGCGNGGKVSDEEKAFGGVVYATGRGIASIGQLTHDFTGTLLYGRGERLHEESALRFFGMVDQVGRRGIFGTIQDGFKRSFEDFNKGLDEGDAFAMGAAAGDAATNAVMIAEGGAGAVRMAVKTAPRAIAVTKSAARVARELSRVQFGLSELELARAVLAGRVRQIGALGVGKIPTLEEARAIVARAQSRASSPRPTLPDEYMNSDHLVSMETARGLPGSTLTATGAVRNANFFWRELMKRSPEMFSKGNRFKVEELGLSPKVDSTWIKFNPKHDSFRGDVLHHHHVDRGPWAIPVPATVHERWSAVLHRN